MIKGFSVILRIDVIFLEKFIDCKYEGWSVFHQLPIDVKCVGIVSQHYFLGVFQDVTKMLSFLKICLTVRKVVLFRCGTRRWEPFC